MEGLFRLAVYVVLLAGLFVAAVAYGGNRMGAFDPVDPPPIPAASGDEPEKKRSKKERQPQTVERQAPARWVRQANAVCASIEPELYSLARRILRATERQDWRSLERVWADIVASERRWNQRIAALGAPPGLASTWRKLNLRLAADEAEARQILAAVQARDALRYAELLEAGSAADQQEDELFRQLGADGCTFEPAAGESF